MFIDVETVKATIIIAAVILSFVALVLTSINYYVGLISICFVAIIALGAGLFTYHIDQTNEDALKDDVSKEYDVKVDKASKESNGVYKLLITDKDGAVKEVYSSRDQNGRVILSEDGNVLRKEQ